MTRTLSPTADERLRMWIENVSRGFSSALELGCGYGQYLDIVRESGCDVCVGIDSFEPYILAGRARFPGLRLHCWDMRFWRDKCPEVEYVQIIDALEHVTKQDALVLIGDLQSAVSRIALFVPIGEHEQSPCDDNEAQAHKSYWWPDDLESLGFDVLVQPEYHSENLEGMRAAAFCVWDKA